MALQLRPNCEYCDKDLPPNSLEARICSYECTFCADCVETKIFNVCPNCGGGFKRSFLEDGDSLQMRAWCQGDGYRVGFGEVEGTILPAE